MRELDEVNAEKETGSLKFIRLFAPKNWHNFASSLLQWKVHVCVIYIVCYEAMLKVHE
jgi:hypothetical protein